MIDTQTDNLILPLTDEDLRIRALIFTPAHWRTLVQATRPLWDRSEDQDPGGPNYTG